MFRASQHPLSGALKTATAASGIGRNTGTTTSFLLTLNHDARNHEFKKKVLNNLTGFHETWSEQCAVTTAPCFHRHINPLNPELNPICYLLALLGAHHFLHVSRIRVKLLTLR